MGVIFENIEFLHFWGSWNSGGGASRDVGMRQFLSTRWLFWSHIPVRVLSFVCLFLGGLLTHRMLSGVGSLR